MTGKEIAKELIKITEELDVRLRAGNNAGAFLTGDSIISLASKLEQLPEPEPCRKKFAIDELAAMLAASLPEGSSMTVAGSRNHIGKTGRPRYRLDRWLFERDAEE